MRRALSSCSFSFRLNARLATSRQRTHVRTLPSRNPPATARTYITYFPALPATSTSARNTSRAALLLGERPVELELYVAEPPGVVVGLLLLRVARLDPRVEDQEERLTRSAGTLVKRDQVLGGRLGGHVH